MNPAGRPPGLILSGGRSSRMGKDKARVLLGKTPMIDHVVNRLAPQVSSIAINATDTVALPTNVELVPDTLEGFAGPLAGILAGLLHTRQGGNSATHLLTVPVDSPFLPTNLVKRLQEAMPGKTSIAVATSQGRVHPVVALWPVALADDLDHWLRDPTHRRVMEFLARHPLAEVAFPLVETAAGPLDPFFNVNTPADLARAEAFLEALP